MLKDFMKKRLHIATANKKKIKKLFKNLLTNARLYGTIRYAQLRVITMIGGRNMEEWIYCGHSDLSLPTWYDEYVRADDNTIVKQVWNDGYEEIYYTEED